MLNSLNVSVGQLPEWYDEGEHDSALEFAIEDWLHSRPEWNGVYVRVEYHYSGDSILMVYDEDGDELFERSIDLSGIFESVQNA